MRRKSISAAGLFLLASCPVLEAQANCDLVWTTVPADSPGDFRASLGAMAAISDTEIWAIGGYQDGRGRKTMIQLWDGERWSIVTCAAVFAIAGTRVTAVAPLPITTTRLSA